MASTRQKILILSLLILLIATNSFAAEPKPPETAAAELQQKKDKAGRMAKDLDQVKQILSEIDPEKIKPEDISVPQDYTNAKEKFETARDSIFTQIENLVGSERFNDPSKDILGGYLKELTDASTSAAVDSALEKVTDAIKKINEQIEEVKYYVTWILKSGLDEYKKKLEDAQQALQKEIKEGSPGSQLAKMKLEITDLLKITDLLTVPQEQAFIKEDDVKKAIKILKIRNDEAIEKSSEPSKPPEPSKTSKPSAIFKVLSAVGHDAQKRELVFFLDVFRDGKKIIDLINKLDINNLQDQKDLTQFATKIKSILKAINSINKFSLKEESDKKFLKEKLDIKNTTDLMTKLKEKDEKNLNYRLDKETWVPAPFGWAAQKNQLKEKLDQATQNNNSPSRAEIISKTEKIQEKEDREQIRTLWAEIVWTALDLPPGGLK